MSEVFNLILSFGRYSFGIDFDSITPNSAHGTIKVDFNVGPPPVLTANPSISSANNNVGTVFTAVHGTYTGTVTGYNQQWYSAGIPIPGATGLTYTSQNSDIGDVLTYEESAYNGIQSNQSATGTSNGLGPITSGGTLSAPTLAFDVANGWTTGQDPPALVLTLPSDGSVQVGDWFRFDYSTASNMAGPTVGTWVQITSDMILNNNIGSSYPWGTTPPPGLTYFAALCGRGVDALHITSISPYSNIINDTLVAWNPSQLFQSGEWGYVFDPSDTTKFFQDSAGTVAGAFGSPIGKLIDVYSGGNHHFTQATTAKQPGAVSPGWMNFDGTDDLLAFAQGSGIGLFQSTTGCSIIIAVNAAARGAVSFMWAEESTSATNPNYAPGTKADNSVSTSQPVVFERNDAGGQNVNSGCGCTLYNSTPNILSIVSNVSGSNETVHSWVNRVAGTDVAYSRSGGTTTLNNTSLGASQRTSELNWWPGELGRAVFINRPLTSAERSLTEAWCAAPYGISLP